ncbi:pyridoxamine 5'-phosphate oxidase family protein [Pseudooceanicola sp. CBS1P-1]|uniref:Pyridoxamine 5'-phosphate oxidase family protein n=1 Tax=Pseudooceanicola albus TaxID=2692189 RepID=A0A6L7G1F5_9RHOB|nr:MULTISPECIES: pyridoxamine 5'-phosphate oxidase family protein [Pseudooceanicola]MBT9384822.1 pyridoxamine 5'-phosphate oxidase family protein [Pseudooceanicola endophyticus]MXN18184.1 pyridoxamine 5'-phosphate oxidase family protein [Pseudooceanicola albus]
MNYLTSIEALEALYGTPGAAATRKVADRLTPEYRRWIEASRFCVVSTVGPEGADGSPRGDDGPVVRALDDQTLLLPDWRGNNRLDTLRNIVRDPRIALMFMVPGSNNAVRVNGAARVTDDADLRASFEKQGRQPATVIVIKIHEIYSQCARAILRAGLWTSGDESADLPTVGEILAAMTEGEVGGRPYDESWAERAARTMW